MNKTVLVAGKDLPYGADFAEALAKCERQVVITGKPDTDKAFVSHEAIAIASWNRPSSISARTLVLQAENAFLKVDEMILYFDASLYASQFTSLSPEECSRAQDTMVQGYQYVAMEFLTRLDARKQNGTLVFINRTHPGMADAVSSPSAKSTTAIFANPFVKSAEKAFQGFAENIAAFVGEKPQTNVVLVSCSSTNDANESDSALATWLVSYIDSLERAKKKPTVRQTLQWLKIGSKLQTGFQLFR